MARYTKVWEDGVETSTLHFRGRDFTITMGKSVNGVSTSNEKSLDIQLEQACPDDEDLDEIIDYTESLDDDFDREEALEALTSFEESEESS